MEPPPSIPSSVSPGQRTYAPKSPRPGTLSPVPRARGSSSPGVPRPPAWGPRRSGPASVLSRVGLRVTSVFLLSPPEQAAALALRRDLLGRLPFELLSARAGEPGGELADALGAKAVRCLQAHRP